jgi:hypothetical protein
MCMMSWRPLAARRIFLPSASIVMPLPSSRPVGEAGAFEPVGAVPNLASFSPVKNGL